MIERVRFTGTAAERAVNGVAMGRKNWLFADHDEAGASHARLHTLIASAERHGVYPQVYVTSILAKIGERQLSELDQLLPNVWRADSLWNCQLATYHSFTSRRNPVIRCSRTETNGRVGNWVEKEWFSVRPGKSTVQSRFKQIL
jgi:hypothetical protein